MKKIIVSAIILLCLFIAIPFTLSAAEENLSFEKDGCVVKNGVMIRYKGSASHLILPEGIRSINLMYEGYFDSADTSMVNRECESARSRHTVSLR
jgi:hypothetical protein